MSLDAIAARTREAGPADAALPLLRLDDDTAAQGLVAWFGADPDRRAARLVIAGEDAGVLDREALYELVADRTLGWGDAIGASLPGDPDWELTELHCPIPGCPHSPVYAVHYDPAAPPHCDEHEDEELAP